MSVGLRRGLVELGLRFSLLGKAGGITPLEAGFDPHCLWNYPGTTRERYWNPSLMRDGKVLAFSKDDYGPPLATDFLIEFIKANKAKPFLAYYPMILPHNPFPPTPDSANRKSKDNKQNFIDMVQYMDKCVGRIEDSLVELGIRENTLIIFTGDNGTNVPDHIDLPWRTAEVQRAPRVTMAHMCRLWSTFRALSQRGR